MPFYVLENLYADLQSIVLSYLFPYLRGEDSERHEIIINHFFELNPLRFQEHINIFNELLFLHKYTKYEEDDKMWDMHYELTDEEKYFCGSQLIDALCTGCTLVFGKGTFSVYTQEIEDDIKFIVQHVPHSLNCTRGVLRCRSDVTPLAMACFNERIPIHIIEFLLQNGADPNSTLKVNNSNEKIINDSGAFGALLRKVRYAHIHNNTKCERSEPRKARRLRRWTKKLIFT